MADAVAGGPGPELVEEVLAEFGRFATAAQQRAFQEWKRRSVSITHLGVLMALRAEGALSMGRLAEQLDVSVASATGIVERMERGGLVSRERDAADRRVVVVKPTAAGRLVMAELAAQRTDTVRRLLNELDARELGSLLVGIRALHAARERIGPEVTPPERGNRT
jgi:4'-phosphopantetheinyl transferase